MLKDTAQLINGKILAENIFLDLKSQINKLNRLPGLAVILIGDDKASHRYVKKKKEACQEVGINFHDYLCGGKINPKITQKEILEMIKFLNEDKETDAIIVQLPIPGKFDTQEIINAINPKKDVDSFHPQNKKNPIVTSPLIQAINETIKKTKENLEGKNTLVISKNPIFADPLKQNLEKQGLKVKLIKPGENLATETSQADILISVVGEPGLIKKSMVKQDAIVIDAGTTLVGKNQWEGDVDSNVVEVASWFTPVPGGVGPLTVAFLLKNTIELAKINQNS